MFCPDYRRGKLMDTRSVWQCWPPVDFNFLTFEFQFPIFPPGTLVYNDLWEMSKIEMSVSFFCTVSKIFRHFLSYLVFCMMFYDGCAWFITIFRFPSKNHDTNSEIDHFQKTTVPPVITLVQQSSPKRPGVNNCNFTWYFSIYRRWEQKWRQN